MEEEGHSLDSFEGREKDEQQPPMFSSSINNHEQY